MARWQHSVTGLITNRLWYNTRAITWTCLCLQIKVWFQNRRTKYKRDKTRDLEQREAGAESRAACNILRMLQHRRSLPPTAATPNLIGGGEVAARLGDRSDLSMIGLSHSHWSNSRVTSPIAIFSRTASATWPVEG